jgi:DNA-binding CsgD family transcriptional regulator
MCGGGRGPSALVTLRRKPSDSAMRIAGNQPCPHISNLRDRRIDLSSKINLTFCPVCFTPRERDVIGVIVRDSSAKAIANCLNISVRTARFHLSNLLDKFKIGTTQEVLYYLLNCETGTTIHAAAADAYHQSSPAPKKKLSRADQLFLGQMGRYALHL